MHAQYAKSLYNTILKGTYAFKRKHTHLWKTPLVEMRPAGSKGEQFISCSLTSDSDTSLLSYENSELLQRSLL